SIINLLSVVVFLPVLNPLSLFLSKFFKEEDTLVTSFVKKEDLAEPGTAFDLFRKEAEFFMYSAMSFNLHLFGLKSRIADMKPQLADLEHRRKLFEKSQEEQYEFLKRLQGELQLYYLSLRSVLQQADQVHRLEHLIAAVRSAMHAAKSVMDITPNIENLRNSSKEEKYSFYIGARQYVADMYAKLEVMFQREGEVTFDELKLVHDEISAHYSHSLEIMYLNAAGGSLSNADFTTIMNLNRELFTSHKAMLMSVKDFRLEPAEAERFSELPVYLT
ncbi:MAG: hypothetical protein JNL88_03755, partial [Bacteroidia bacterium]|nr:hypothetical protein [Bacteroidia bacterium]